MARGGAAAWRGVVCVVGKGVSARTTHGSERATHAYHLPLPLLLPAGAARAARLPAPRAHRSRRSLPPPPAVRWRPRPRAAEPREQAPSQPVTAGMLVFRADPLQGAGTLDTPPPPRPCHLPGAAGRGQGWLCLTISRALLLRVSIPGRRLCRAAACLASRTPLWLAGGARTYTARARCRYTSRGNSLSRATRHINKFDFDSTPRRRIPAVDLLVPSTRSRRCGGAAFTGAAAGVDFTHTCCVTGARAPAREPRGCVGSGVRAFLQRRTRRDDRHLG